MYLTKASFNNIGPLSSVTIQPTFDPNGAPDPIVLVGANGSGKTIILAAIMDAMVEARKKVWHKSPEVTAEQYIRYMSASYVRSGSDFLQTEVVFGSPALGFEQHEFATRLDSAAFQSAHPTVRFAGEPIAQQIFDNAGLAKRLLPHGDIKTELQATVLF